MTSDSKYEVSHSETVQSVVIYYRSMCHKFVANWKPSLARPVHVGLNISSSELILQADPQP